MPPLSVISLVTDLQLSIFLLVIMTFAPCWEKVFAIDLPIPRLPPVTIAVFPFRSKSCSAELVTPKLPLQPSEYPWFGEHFQNLNLSPVAKRDG